MGVKITVYGHNNVTEKYLTTVSKKVSMKKTSPFYKKIESICQTTIETLRYLTPVDSGKTADSWGYDIENTKNSITVTIYNTNVNDGVNVALLIEYGHATKDGEWVAANPYINATVSHTYLDILNNTWEELKNL